jgi:hypothetical protein
MHTPARIYRSLLQYVLVLPCLNFHIRLFTRAIRLDLYTFQFFFPLLTTWYNCDYDFSYLWLSFLMEIPVYVLELRR